jgi:DNA invertase Pin-like site-specific DNA recombinase
LRNYPFRDRIGGLAERRTELETIMQFMHTGDELVVLRLDRLGRSTRDVLNLVHELDERELRCASLSQR